ncbi:MAG: ABC transporter substrate-binding protein [Steroidobacteraceae bacterium]|nr:ABC transporter substrate-binding protein [Steroidobacteraceae bacterium]
MVALSWLSGALTSAGAATFTDDTGTAITLARPAARIVALAPGATALLFAAGAGERVIATIEHADEPAGARQLPRLGDLQAIDLERLVALRPDVVVVTDAITSPLMTSRVRALGMPVYTTRYTRLDQIPPSLARLGRLAGTPDIADAAAARLGDELAALRAQYAKRRPIDVLYQVWNRPIYSIGGTHIVTDALTLCGARNAFAGQRIAAPSLGIEAVIARNPDVIVVSAPRDIAVQWAAEWRAYPRLAATSNDRVYVFDDQRLDRMGPSAIDAAAALCRLLDAARQ